ncbi:MAG TPA: lipocalin family protein [Paenirhodobacter sp.]
MPNAGVLHHGPSSFCSYRINAPLASPTRLPAKGLDITTRALNDQAWNALSVPYWEGPIRAAGSHPGHGYLEMTRYGATAR